jgi:FixJ family two-component response regulator
MNFKHACPVRSTSELSAKPIVFIVDADAAVRDALELLMRSVGFEPRSASSAEQFLAIPPATTPSCLLLETRLPGLSGLELQRLVVDRVEMPTIFISANADVPTTVRAMKAGASEFLVKPLAEQALLAAIRDAHERSRTALRQVARTHALQERYESLSRREREVMGLVVSGRLNKQVGGDLGISEITVKAHRGKLMRKMQAASFAELVGMAMNLRRSVALDTANFDVRPNIPTWTQRPQASHSYAHA